MEGDAERAAERVIDDKNLYHDRGSPNASAGSLEKLPFELQEGEKIVRELKPQFFGYMITRTFNSYLGVLAIIVLSIMALIVFRNFLISFLPWLFLAPLAILLLILVIALGPLISYGKSWYWITNHRVIGKRGFLAYSINSIPLENVTDIVISRTLLDRFLGLSSLIIMPMAGRSRIAGDTDTEKAQSREFFPALTQETARELQRVLFNLRDELKKPKQVSSAVTTPGVSEPTTAGPAAPPQPKRDAAPTSPQSKKSNSKEDKNN